MRTVAIVGVGLIGGSFGLALRKAGFRARSSASVPSAASIRPPERGAIDRGATARRSRRRSGSDLSLAAHLRYPRDPPRTRPAASARSPRHGRGQHQTGHREAEARTHPHPLRLRWRTPHGRQRTPRSAPPPMPTSFSGRPWVLNRTITRSPRSPRLPQMAALSSEPANSSSIPPGTTVWSPGVRTCRNCLHRAGLRPPRRSARCAGWPAPACSI